jgi:hypothetical protein
VIIPLGVIGMIVICGGCVFVFAAVGPAGGASPPNSAVVDFDTGAG